MELLGRKLSIEETIGFIWTISTESSAQIYCKGENCLVMQAAVDLAGEVERLQTDIQSEKEEIIGGHFFEGEQIGTGKKVKGYLMLRPDDFGKNSYYLISPSGHKWYAVYPDTLCRTVKEQGDL